METTAIVFRRGIFRLDKLPQLPIEFNAILWRTLVNHGTVQNDEQIVFPFTDGQKS